MKSAKIVPGLDKEISQLALGTAWMAEAPEAASFALFDAYAARGGTVLDTGRIYGSEAVIGAWLRKTALRDRFVLITKGAHGDGAGVPPEAFEPTVDRELDESLAALGLDCVDLYFLHRDSPGVPIERIVDHLNGLADAGKLRAFGFSNVTYERARQACAYAARSGLTPPAAISNNLSLAVPAAPFYPGLVSTGEKGVRWHAETGIPLFSWSSQARGFFTGRYAPGADGTNAFDRRMMEVYGTPQNFERLRRAAQLGEARGGYTAMEIALAWLLCRRLPVVPLIGPRSPAELESCLRATALDLTAEELTRLAATGPSPRG